MRYRFVSRDSGDHPVDIVAIDGANEEVLFSQDSYMLDGETIVVNARTATFESTSEDWEDKPQLAEDLGGTIAATSELLVSDAFIAYVNDRTLVYRTGNTSTSFGGTISIEPTLDDTDTGFPYWWSNF
jgi:hypothetical protein